MNAKTRTTLIVSFIGIILLFLLFSSMVITGALSNGGMMGSERMAGISWMWIPTLLSLGLVFLIGWTIFSKNIKPVQKL
jgi:cation transport ATPase